MPREFPKHLQAKKEPDQYIRNKSIFFYKKKCMRIFFSMMDYYVFVWSHCRLKYWKNSREIVSSVMNKLNANFNSCIFVWLELLYSHAQRNKNEKKMLLQIFDLYKIWKTENFSVNKRWQITFTSLKMISNMLSYFLIPNELSGYQNEFLQISEISLIKSCKYTSSTGVPIIWAKWE